MLSLLHFTNQRPLHFLVVVSIAFFALTNSTTAQAASNQLSKNAPANDKHASIFKQAAAKHGISETVLRSICEVESQNNPWAFNVNGEGFQPDSLTDALNQIDSIHSRPWLLKLSFKRQASTRLFYRNKKDAQLALIDILQDAKHWGFEAPKKTHIRLLDVKSTDIGYMQINWRFHGRHFNSMADLYDPAVNIDYSARYIKKLIRRHGSMSKAVAFYHSNTQRYQAIYLDNFWPIYQKHILLARN
ncbi:MAG: transglycosylase SLT domain-containing protein [Pseudomonadales bacterium]|nr:transglycosylase SLT domain-containing protein [Pseudomonadales bacterium]